MTQSSNQFNTAPTTPNADPGYVSAGQPNSVPGSMLVRFSDGEHALPGYIIHHLGAQEVERMRPELSSITYGDFVGNFHKEVEETGYKKALNAVIRNHFENISRRF